MSAGYNCMMDISSKKGPNSWFYGLIIVGALIGVIHIKS
jgi:hypothetical protein